MIVSERIKPTPETLAKAGPDIIWRLEASGYLMREHVQAAHDIEDAFRALTNPVSWRLMRSIDTLQGPVVALEGRTLSTPGFLAAMSARAADAVQRYNNWTDELSRRGWHGVYGLTVDAVTENVGLRQLERRWSHRNGMGKFVLREGLNCYAEVQGWV